MGVLAEVRGCYYIDYCYTRIPVTVADDPALVGETVCTVNTARVWVEEGAMDGVSWKDGVWDDETEKNTLANYVEIDPIKKEYAGGNGFLAENSAGSFTKVEYNGQGGCDTGTAGKLDGASLLILGYKANVVIQDEKSMETGLNHYSPTEGQTSVTWVVHDIKTEAGTTQNTYATRDTDLTIPVTLQYNSDTDGVDQSQPELFYIAANSSFITEYLWEEKADGTLELDENGKAIPKYKKNIDGSYVLDDQENKIQETVVKRISTSADPAEATEITFRGTYTAEDGTTKDTLYTYKIYAQEDITGKTVTYYILDAPVGQSLPNISFRMSLGNSLNNDDAIMATAAISGSGDSRAYSEAAGNQVPSTIYISKTGVTQLVKKVDIAYGDIGSTINYTVTYTNETQGVVRTAYFYDNLPYNNDIRGSVYDMGETGTNTDYTSISNINFRSITANGEETNDFQAIVTVYYPIMTDEEFKELMYGFSTESTTDDYGQPNAEKINNLLKSGKFGILMQSEKYTDSSGTHARFHRTYAEREGWVVKDVNNNCIFEKDENGYLVPKMTEEGKTEYPAFLSTLPGVVVKVEGMGANRSIEMSITMKTSENKAKDTYINDAWQWTEGSPVLQSNPVQTQIVSRAISGRIWVDENLNGLYDENEKSLNGVTCTLFKLDDDTSSSTYGQYVQCTTDVVGRTFGTITSGSYTYTYYRPNENGEKEEKTVDAYKTSETKNEEILYQDEHGHLVTGNLRSNGEDGAYRFNALEEGDYIVAFSGGGIEDYGGATTYQVNKKNDEISNDGVALIDTPDSNLDAEKIEMPGIESEEYSYAIAYHLGGENKTTAEAVKTHSVDEIVSDKSLPVTDLVEHYTHQDLGLVIYADEYELPETGGTGTILYIAGGAMLAIGAGILLVYRRKKHGKEANASS